MILFSYCIPFLCIFISSAFCLHRICLPLRAPSSGQSSLTRAIFVFAKPKKGNTKRKLEPDDDFDEDIAKNWDLQGLDISLSETAAIENALENDVLGSDSQTHNQSMELSETVSKSANGSIEKKLKPKNSSQDGIEGSRKQRIENTIRSLVLENQLTIAKISWFSGRLEVTVTDTLLEDSVVSINAEQLQNLHTAIYSELEGYDEAFLVENEVDVKVFFNHNFLLVAH